MKKTLSIAAAAAVVILTLSGCSAGATAKTYTAANLVSVLSKTEHKLGVSGTIEDNAKLAAALKTAGSTSLGAELKASGDKIEPATCATALEKAVPSSSKGYGLGSKGVEATLTYGTSAIGISTVAGGQVPSSTVSSITGKISSLLTTCGNMKIVADSVTVGMTIKKLTITTHADQTYGFVITIKLGTSTNSTTLVEAVSGNLVIAASGTGTSTKSAVAAINAVIAEAKG